MNLREGERRMKWWKQLYWDLQSDFGELVVLIIGLILCVLICSLVWMGIVGVESYLR